MQLTKESGTRINNRSLSLCVFLFGLALNQSAVISGKNLSIADLFLIIILIYLLLRKDFVVPMQPLVAFLILSVFVIFTSTLFVPASFPIVPELGQILGDYLKLLVVFVYLLVGYNLVNIGLTEHSLEGFFWGAIFAGLLSLLSFVGIRLSYLYYGNSIRFQGFMNDPNYFAVLQNCAIALLLDSRSGAKRVALLLILIVSILTSGSKTGLIVLAIYSAMKFLTRLASGLLRNKIRLSRLVTILFIMIAIIGLFPFMIGRDSGIIQNLSNYIPQFRRLETLFKNFGRAIAADGSSRNLTWKVALNVISVSPILGVGVGTYAAIARALTGVGTLAHNTYLQMGAEWGLPLALIFFISVVILLLKPPLSMLKAKKPEKLLIHACKDMIFVFLLGSLAISLNNARFFWLIFGMLLRLTTGSAREKDLDVYF